MKAALSGKELDLLLARAIPSCKVESRTLTDGTFNLMVHNPATHEHFTVAGLNHGDYQDLGSVLRLGKQVFEDMVLLQAGSSSRRIIKLASAQQAEARQAL
ncbi:hypothetical protein [Pseudomonas sp. zfem005]|uniref:hypothetical protein n=1 Tax=Pseudomonas sp. zfem005 TaxID=3078200 RepID=UPI002929128C|nr:hypothetical protein [Pseudomonas sp. zfem005]MDU9412792.1 hypothetical protein [Pseudomonas sp. zfem005]